MRTLGVIFTALTCTLLAILAPDIATARERLEDVSVGKFKASGIVRQKPGSPPERLFCRLTGQKTDPATLKLAGRCANATNSAPLKMHMKVVKPGQRYRLVTVPPGYEHAMNFTGSRHGSNVIFSADTLFDGVRYRSRFTISINHTGIARIVESVTHLDTGKTTTLIDIKVRRE